MILFIFLIFFLLFIYVVHNSILESIPLAIGGSIYFLLLIVSLFVLVYSVIKLFVNRDKGIIKIILSFIISLILIIAMVINYNRVFDSLKGKGYLYTLNYKRVKEGLDTNFKDNYKVLGLRGKKIKVGDDTICDYVYDVSLNDGSNVVFQAYYCSFSFMAVVMDFSCNYNYHYLLYYYDLYKKSHNVTFKIEDNDDIYSNHTIIYNYSNREEVVDFLYYFDDNTVYNQYDFTLRNEDTNKVDHIRRREDLRYIR